MRLVGTVAGREVRGGCYCSEYADTKPLLLESTPHLQATTGVNIANSLVQPSSDGTAKVLLRNNNTLTHKVAEGTAMGYGRPVEVVESKSRSIRGRGYQSCDQ